MLPTKFRVKWHFGSGEEVKNRLSRWPPSWISDCNDFSYFWSTSHLDASYQFSIGPLVQEKKQKEFQDGGHSVFPIGMILAIFDLQVTQMLPTKFRVNWPFCSGEEAKKRFWRWLPWRPSWISDRSDFSFCWSTSHLDTSNELWVKCPFSSGEKVQNRFSRWPPFGRRSENRFSKWLPAAILDFQSEWFQIFFIYQLPRCFLPSFQSVGLWVHETKQK